ncbi:hypothetical protein [Maridesulfovibrio sp.]|uniref:hypothetical protein n=1 Tax=Maridesulfovibrio sp. TaxID=2795000 RepID=UPI0029C9DA65|nr:hypothetical protein [Maridesulfovibrio sp.]
MSNAFVDDREYFFLGPYFREDVHAITNLDSQARHFVSSHAYVSGATMICLDGKDVPVVGDLDEIKTDKYAVYSIDTALFRMLDYVKTCSDKYYSSNIKKQLTKSFGYRDGFINSILLENSGQSSLIPLDPTDMLWLLCEHYDDSVRDELKTLYSSDKKAYFDSAYWQILRIHIAYSYNCHYEGCNNSANTMHHLTYDIVGEEHLHIGEKLVPLCRTCHFEKIHNGTKNKDYRAEANKEEVNNYLARNKVLGPRFIRYSELIARQYYEARGL